LQELADHGVIGKASVPERVSMSAFDSLLVQLKRRHVYRVAVVYAAVGWLLVQVVTQVFPVFSFPAWTEQLAVLVLLGGFPIALVLAWAYELKPDGVHRDTSTQVEPGRKRNHRTDIAIGLLVVLSLTVTAVIWSAHRTPAISAQVMPATVAQTQAPPRSVAVLPFDNMSGDPRQKYFSEGVSSELIGLLARNPALHVAARTSSFFFEGKAQDVRVVAQKLNVRSILEGSIQSDSSRVHIEVSLVNAADGYQLWSQSYDRSLNDILAVQTEIAHSIAAALAPTLAGTSAKPIPKPAQIDPEIYRDYLRGQFYFDQRLNEGQTPASMDALNRSVELFRKVAAASPDFADGEAAFARALAAVEKGTELDGQIHAALARALAIDPENPQALDMAILVASGNWNWDDVIKDALILKRTAAHTAAGAEGLSHVFFAFALWDERTVATREWVHFDPFSYAAWAALTNNYFAEAHYEDAINAASEALALHPDDPVSREYQCVSFASLDRIAEANAVLDALSKPGIPVPLQTHCKFFIILHGTGAKAAIAFVDSVLTRNPDSAGPSGDVGFMLSHTGAINQAMDWYEKAFNRNGWAFGFYPGKTAPQSFLQSPRWIVLTRQPEYQRWLAARQRARSELASATP
jgi:TolB-like protein